MLEVLGDLHFSLQQALGILKLPEVHTVTAPEILVDDESKQLLEHCRSTVGERAMLLALLGAGLRSAELVALDGIDVREDLAAVPSWRFAASGHERFVPIQPGVLASIRDYLGSTGRQLG